MSTLKLAGILGMMLVFLAGCLVLEIVSKLGGPSYNALWLTQCCRFGLKVLGVELKIEGSGHLAQAGQAPLLMGNHLSYIDILLLSSVTPVAFITSQEVRETFGIGTLCQWAGCLFVERRNHLKRANELEDLRRALTAKRAIVVFLEGTSTNGERV
jgi:1-acyl-sn-glycerol-3-phosphate acyltransferase